MTCLSLSSDRSPKVSSLPVEATTGLCVVMMDNSSPIIERLTQFNDVDREAIREILDQAYQDNVHLRSFYDKPERRPAKIEFELQVAQLFLADIWVIRTQQGDDTVVVGVALLWPPGVDIWKDERVIALDKEYKRGASSEWLAWRAKSDEVMGAIHRCLPESDKRYHLDFFAVLRTHREKGFGSRLMKELLRVARDDDKVLSLTCAPEVLGFYESLEMRVRDRTPWELLDGSMSEFILVTSAA